MTDNNKTPSILETVRLHWREARNRSFITLGGIWLFLEVYLAVTDTSTKAYSLFALGLISLASILGGVVWTVRDLSGTSFTLRGTNTRIEVAFGDVFGETAALIVPVNEFFDHRLEDVSPTVSAPVSATSIHGQVIGQLGAAAFRQAVDKILGSRPSQAALTRSVEPKQRFPLGTLASITDSSGRMFHLVATTRTNLQSMKAEAKLTEMFGALADGLAGIADVNNDEPLVLPLIGSGFARSRIDEEHLLDIVIATIVEVSIQQRGRIAHTIRIVLSPELKGVIRCYNVRREWS